MRNLCSEMFMNNQETDMEKSWGKNYKFCWNTVDLKKNSILAIKWKSHTLFVIV